MWAHINIGPVYVRGWAGGVWGGMDGAKTKKQDDTVVEFRVAMTSTFTHKEPIFHYKSYRQTCDDRGSNIRSLLSNWSPPLAPFYQSLIYMVRKKYSGKVDQLTLEAVNIHT